MTRSLAYRIGAPNASCYGHEIDHPTDLINNNGKQVCIGLCRADLKLIDEVNEADFSQLLNVGIDYLSCGSVYRCKLIS